MRPLLTVIPFCAAYVVAGILTAQFARSSTSIEGRASWRLAAWGISLLVYGLQFAVERLRFHRTALRSAANTAAAVAIAALALAAWGPVRAHWGAAGQNRALMSLLLWPVVMGLPSFVLALGMGAVVGRWVGRTQTKAS